MFLHDEARKDFGQFLRQRRRAAHVTQADVARSFGYSTAQYVSNWERGVSTPPRKALPALAELLEIPPRLMLDAIHEFHIAAARRESRELERLFKKTRKKKTRDA